LHGFPTSSYDWREFLGPLSKFGRVVAPDLYGFGYSEAPKGMDTNRLFDLIPGLVSAMSFDRVTLAAYDAGGVGAMSYAVLNPTKVARLIIMNTTAYPDWVAHSRTSPDYAPIRRMMSNSLFRWIALRSMNRKLVHQILTGNSGVKLSDAVLEQQSFFIKRGFRTLASMKPSPYTEAFYKAFEESLAQLAKRISELRVPTLIVFGKDDPFFPHGTAEHLHQDIAGSELRVLDGTGHFLLEQRPQQVLELITTFLSRTV
jgi:pimeloyl-ACP methyl ester carboxylesterase